MEEKVVMLSWNLISKGMFCWVKSFSPTTEMLQCRRVNSIGSNICRVVLAIECFNASVFGGLKAVLMFSPFKIRVIRTDTPLMHVYGIDAYALGFSRGFGCALFQLSNHYKHWVTFSKNLRIGRQNNN